MKHSQTQEIYPSEKKRYFFIVVSLYREREKNNMYSNRELLHVVVRLSDFVT